MNRGGKCKQWDQDGREVTLKSNHVIMATGSANQKGARVEASFR